MTTRKKRPAASRAEDTDGSAAVAQRLLYELRVHQIELEAQNEELRRMQRELDASLSRYIDLYDRAPVGYCTVSEKGLILEANLTLAALLGAAPAVLVKHSLSRYIRPEAADDYHRFCRSMCSTGEPQTFELQLMKADGAVFWASLAATMSRVADGAPTLRFVISDVGERKRAEGNAAALEAQLRQAQKLESVGLLAGGVSHEFNNMLAVILGNTELALKQVDPSHPLHADLLEVYKAAERSSGLTRQLLAFARSHPVAPQILDLSESVPGLVTMLQRLIGEDIQVVWQADSKLWPVLMDPAQLDQILANLVVNARHAIVGIGTLTIAVSNRIIDGEYCATHATVAPGEYVRLTVSDTGSGMDAETVSHIYEPLFTTKAVGQGTGLGLAMVYGAVRQNGGFITVSSAPGQGATFEIHLPRHVRD
jgi:PAS domain S-box-containing protein